MQASNPFRVHYTIDGVRGSTTAVAPSPDQARELVREQLQRVDKDASIHFLKTKVDRNGHK